MFDAKKLLDVLVGSAAGGGKSATGGPSSGLGGMLGDVLGQMTGGGAGYPAGGGSALGRAAGGGRAAGDLLGKALDYLKTPRGNLAASAVVVGLAGLLLGSKGGRKIASSAAKIGGLALIGGLAYAAYRNWQAGQAPAAQPGEAEAVALPAPQSSPFNADAASQDTALLLLRAMIAAASADGHVDDAERRSIIGGLKEAGFDMEASQFLDAELARPASVAALAAGAATPEIAVEVYTAARLAIEPDETRERVFLAELAGALKLDPQLVAQIDAAAAQVKLSA
ncbi:DUF533 domain-containing protein [Chelatococcus sp. SYSU_G07232]|uniref:DUF533 domain-containing protein n=1 Tax=Chelatococcus albus TaxID=3047466 RepID=A0ABT7ALE7_9HYPH|nr:DUF533 domain-containing protein [Chelatococcus sp. SYSU_G07232]MDJ1160203.1 DUF533 domain-containing protein [Chelatococcus sp. SYSU_G07232]